MGGIAGFISREDTRAAERRILLDAMCRAITHRGPDEQGMAVEGRAAIGVRRLSVIDLKTGQQPIYNRDRSKLIVFNGEIYNYRELRRNLAARGHSFRTDSDTETILRAYDEYGTDCLRLLRGMFAFAIWDSTEQCLFAARDRVGEKPLFYSVTAAGEFVFGSELRVLLTHGSVTREIDHAALDAYLTFGYVPEELCIFKGVHKLEPGHFLTFRNGVVRTEKYWDFDQSGGHLTESEDEIAGDLLEKLRDAVRSRLVSEVPLGAFLSGGVDSTAVVGLMSQIIDRPVKTFSIGFSEDGTDEFKYARIAAKRFKTEHHEFVLTPDLADAVDDMVGHMDEPFADRSALPTYLLSKLAREFVTVVLSSDGGDQIFAGGMRNVDEHSRSGLGHLPRAIRDKLIRLFSEAMPNGTTGRDHVFNISLDAAASYIDSISQFDRSRKRRLYAGSHRTKMNGSFGRGEAIYGEIATSVSTGNETDSLHYLENKTYLPGAILTGLDRMTMASSIEARSPLLDHKLIEFAAKIPTDPKLKGGEKKYIFRKAVEALVPREILDREKQGSDSPAVGWNDLQLGERICADLGDRRTRERGYFDMHYIDILLDEHRSGRLDHSNALWTLWMFEMWQRRYIDAGGF